MNRTGKVILCGAGCWDPSWLTCKAKEAIEAADVIVYDALLSKDLLDMNSRAEKIGVGKRKGMPSWKQDEINALLLEKARENRTVVRLKGGDPFVFGRGKEEELYLKKHGIDVERIPGISSALGLLLEAGIPITHRGMAASFTVLSASTLDGKHNESWATIASLKGTLVFLMGRSKIKDICDQLIQNGKAPTTPAACISSWHVGSIQGVQGDLSNLAKEADESHLPSPAIIVVGPAVSFMDPTIRNKPVPVGFCTSSALKKRVIDECALSMDPIQVLTCNYDSVELEAFQLKQALKQTWLVFTSWKASTLFLEQLNSHQMDLRSLAQTKIACMGPATAIPFTECGIIPDFISAGRTSEAFGQELLSQSDADTSFALFCSRQSRPVLAKVLSEHHSLLRFPIYGVKWKPVATQEEVNELAALVFGSPISIEAFFEHYTLPPHCQSIVLSSVSADRFLQWMPENTRPPLIASDVSASGLAGMLMSVSGKTTEEK